MARSRPTPVEPIVASPLQGQTIGRPRGSFVMAEWRDEGGPRGPPRLIAPLHVHRRDDEGWYIVEGRLMFRLDRREVEAPSGSAVIVPPGVAHTFWNPDPSPARYLVLMTPNLRGLIEDLHSLADRTPAAVRAVFRDHGSEILA